jgi:hypothetical protein
MNKIESTDNINTILPPEILLQIFEYVELGPVHYTPSYLGNLFKCEDCYISQIKCVHIDEEELKEAYNIRLTCNYWNELIGSHFKFITKWWL